MERLANLIDPVPVPAFVSAICEWLQDAHDAAADLQRVRLSGPRGNWNNPTSFGTDRYQFLVRTDRYQFLVRTDRYQFLVRTAGSLTAALPELQVDSAFQTVALKLPKVGIYQMQVHGGPHGSLADASDLRRELLNSRDHQALFSRPDALFGDRQRLTLLWTGTEKDGLTGAWIGQGELVENHIDWLWKESLHDVTGAVGIPRQTGPLDPAIFDLPEPTLPLRPRDPDEGSQTG